MTKNRMAGRCKGMV